MERANYKNFLLKNTNLKLKIISDNFETNPKWQYLAKKSDHPEFSTCGKLVFSKNLLPIRVYRKISKLYESILKAKIVMLRYKSHLATVLDVNNDSITPLTSSKSIPMLFYKREDLTCIKAYKIRGALYQMSKIIEKHHSANLNFIAASTGNHALGVLKAAEILCVPAVTICISNSVTDFKKKKLENRINELKKSGIDAKLVIEGDNFDQTNKHAIDTANNCKDTFYIDPYNTHNAVAGQGTIGLEILTQLEEKYFHPEILEYDLNKLNKLKQITIIVPIGGGGLISGIATSVLMDVQTHPKFKNLDVSVIGVKLNDLNSLYGDAIKVKYPGKHNQDLLEYLITKKISVNDADMKRGIDFISNDIEALVEGASSATLKPIFDRIVQPSEENAVICIISGGNINF